MELQGALDLEPFLSIVSISLMKIPSFYFAIATRFGFLSKHSAVITHSNSLVLVLVKISFFYLFKGD